MTARRLLQVLIVLVAGVLATSPAFPADRPPSGKKSKHSSTPRHQTNNAQRHQWKHTWVADEWQLPLGMNCCQRVHLNRLDEKFGDGFVELMHKYYSQPHSNILHFQNRLNHFNRFAESHARRVLTPMQRYEVAEYPWQVYSLSVWDEGFPRGSCGDFRCGMESHPCGDHEKNKGACCRKARHDRRCEHSRF